MFINFHIWFNSLVLIVFKCYRIKSRTKYNQDINQLMTQMNALLVSMSVNKYRRNGSTDWTQRPECSDILSQLFMANKPIIQENYLTSLDSRVVIIFFITFSTKQTHMYYPKVYDTHRLNDFLNVKF